MSDQKPGLSHVSSAVEKTDSGTIIETFSSTSVESIDSDTERITKVTVETVVQKKNRNNSLNLQSRRLRSQQDKMTDSDSSSEGEEGGAYGGHIVGKRVQNQTVCYGNYYGAPIMPPHCTQGSPHPMTGAPPMAPPCTQGSPHPMTGAPPMAPLSIQGQSPVTVSQSIDINISTSAFGATHSWCRFCCGGEWKVGMMLNCQECGAPITYFYCEPNLNNSGATDDTAHHDAAHDFDEPASNASPPVEGEPVDGVLHVDEALEGADHDREARAEGEHAGERAEGAEHAGEHAEGAEHAGEHPEGEHHEGEPGEAGAEQHPPEEAPSEAEAPAEEEAAA